MKPVFWIFIVLLLTSNVCLGDGDFVSKNKFGELKRIVEFLKNTVDEGKTKYDDLYRKYKQLEEKFHQVSSELDEIKFRFTSSDQESSETSSIVEKSKHFQDDESRQRVVFHNADQKNGSEIIENRFSQKSQPITYGARKRSISSLPGRGAGTQQVAFYAREVQDHSGLGIHQTLIFKKVITNIGNNYNPYMGVFICTTPGVYAFFLSTVTYPNTEIHTEIVKNGVTIAFNAASCQYSFDQVSTMAVIQLNQGDNVWVRIYSVKGSGQILSDPENSFSGFLLFSI